MIDIVLLQEPNKSLSENQGWIVDYKRDVGIKGFSSKVEISQVHDTNSGLVIAVMKDICVFNCYISPNCPMDEFEQYLIILGINIQHQTKQCIIGGDFNAKSEMWGSASTDTRGEYLLNWSAALKLVILNQGTEPTFDNGRHQSVIDITFCTEKISKWVNKWQILEDESLSDHRYIFYEIKHENQRSDLHKRHYHLGWHLDNLEVFRTLFVYNIKRWKEENNNSVIDPVTLQKIVIDACNNSLTKKVKGKRIPNYWWTNELNELRANCLRAKRILTRTRRHNVTSLSNVIEQETHYKNCRRMLKNGIVNAKQNAWKNIRDDIENDTWGLAYKIVVGKLRATPLKLTDEQQVDIVTELFPTGKQKNNFSVNTVDNSTPLFTREELKDSVSRIKHKKAAGPDKLLPEICKAVIQEDPSLILNMMNHLLQQGVFPAIWKIARVVLIEKPRKLDEPQKYRPICLLGVMGKLYEHLITTRLVKEVEMDLKLCEHQYGFRKGRSTINAMQAIVDIVEQATNKAAQNRKFCLLITLDIKNAFNTASWNGIMKALEAKNVSVYLRRVINDYLADRKILIGENEARVMTCGVPQGSVLGPILWNVFYDSVLRVKVPAGTHIIGYADDTAVVITAKSVDELVSNANTSLCLLSREIKRKGLLLAPEKTEALILYGGRRVKDLTLSIDEWKVRTKSSLKYLGVTFDYNLRMTEHVKICCVKAERTANALARLMPNNGGPRDAVRRTLAFVVHSIILYAVPIWEKALRLAKYQKMVKQAQRRMALRICSAFKTVSTDAALAISSLPPICILAEERTRKYRGGDSELSILERWQREWQTQNERALWTKILIKDLVTWCSREHGEVDYYLTQILTGHGWFGSYQRRFHRNSHGLCDVCGVEDTAEHTFFKCDEWQDIRTSLTLRVGRTIKPDNLVDIMLEREENWKSVTYAAKTIMQIKQKRIIGKLV